MIIKEEPNVVKVRAASMNTADRPLELKPYLNFYGLSIIIGLPASGKTSLINALLTNTGKNRLYNKIFHSVYYISPSTTLKINLPENKYISLDDKNLDTILEEIIENEKGEGEEDDNHRVLIVLDDAINFLNANKRAMNLYRKLVYNARHVLGDYSSCMVWIVSQKLKAIPLAIRSQANSIYFFESTAREKEVLLDEFLPLDKHDGYDIFEYIFDKPYNFVYINTFFPKNKRVFKNFNQLILSELQK